MHTSTTTLQCSKIKPPLYPTTTYICLNFLIKMHESFPEKFPLLYLTPPLSASAPKSIVFSLGLFPAFPKHFVEIHPVVFCAILHTTGQMVGGGKDNLKSFFCLLSPLQHYKPYRVAYKVCMHTLLMQLTTCLDLLVGETLWSTVS